MPAPASIEAGLAASEPLRAVREAIAEPAGTWIVGGAIRDAALGLPIVDLDIATDGDPQAIAAEIAKRAGAAVFELSGEHGTWRVEDRRRRWWIDIAALRGATIEADLALRDFTVNAVAVPLYGGEPIDPTGGLRDLEAGLLRAASPRCFEDDPLRLMRAARLAASLGLAVDPSLRELAGASVGRANEPAGERRFAELREIIAGPDPLQGLALLEQLGVADVILPELAVLHGVVQNANHHLDVHEHTIEVLRRWLAVEADLAAYAGEAAAGLATLLDQPLGDGLSRREGVRFAALLHDIGKPATREEIGGFVSFKGHDRAGAEMLRELCARFRTSRKTSDYLSRLTRDHLILGFMVRERPLPRRRVWDYLRRTQPWSIDVTLLTIADRLSARGLGVGDEAIQAHLGLAREMLAAGLEWEQAGPPAPLIRGDELAEAIGIELGEQLGALMLEQEAALYCGEVADRDQLLAHLRALELTVRDR